MSGRSFPTASTCCIAPANAYMAVTTIMFGEAVSAFPPLPNLSTTQRHQRLSAGDSHGKEQDSL